MNIKVKELEFKNKPVLALYDEDGSEKQKKYPIMTIGIKKAKAIVAGFEHIKKFVEKQRF